MDVPDYTEPHLLGEAQTPPFRVAPQDRFKAVETQIRAARSLGMGGIRASRQTRESTTKSSVDLTVLLEILELRYPGDVGDWVPPAVGTWAYVFDMQARACIIEASREAGADGSGVWLYRRATEISPSSLASSPAMPLRHREGVELDPERTTSTSSVAVFLSPTRLSRGGLEYLLNQMLNEQPGPAWPFVSPTWFTPAHAIVAVPEPISWVIAASFEYHIPVVDEYQEWIQDPERNAKVFVATVLREWIKGPIDQVKNNLRSGEPGKFLAKNAAAEQKLREAAARAASYLIACVDSPEHRAVEISAMEIGGLPLEELFVNFGVALTGMLLTPPGRDYIATLVKDTDRLPMRYLFADSPPTNIPVFANARYAWIGAKQIAGNLIAKVIENRYARELKASTDAARAAAIKETRQAVQSHLSRLLESGQKLDGTETLIHARLSKGLNLTNWISAGRTSNRPIIRDIEVTYQHLTMVVGRGAAEERATKRVAELVEGFSERRLSIAAYAGKFDKIAMPVLALVEVANLSMAVTAWKESTGDDDSVAIGPFGLGNVNGGTLALIGGVSDTAGVVTDIMEAFGKGGVKRIAAAGGLAIISGTVEMLTYEREFVKAAYGRRNYGQSVGYAVAAGGGAIAAVGGGMTLAFALSGKSLFAGAAGGPVGVVVGAIGAILILAGFGLATFLARDPYEEFAETCFLGDSSNDEVSWGFDWAPDALPLRSPLRQAQLLVMLLSAFNLRRTGSGDPYPEQGLPNPLPSGARGGPGSAPREESRDAALPWLRAGLESIPGRTQGAGGGSPESWIEVDLGHFPVGSHMDFQIKQRYGGGHFSGPGVEYIAHFKVVHASPGRVEVRPEGSSSTMLMLPVEYAVESESIKALRFPLQPQWIHTQGSASPPIRFGDFARQRECRACVVRARLWIADQAATFAYIPRHGEWLEFDAADDSSASALDTGKYKS
jgi:hypothetical protein